LEVRYPQEVAMRTTIFIAAFVLAFPAWGQAKKPAAPEKAAKAEKTEKTEKAEKSAKKASPAKRQQDARHCLNEPSNTAVIKCAEAYL
jgi:hypothetical protein